MDITLYVNNSEKNRIGKTLTEVQTLSGSIKEPSFFRNGKLKGIGNIITTFLNV